MTNTATELRETAARQDQEAAASFERCDTDGFLSQWASGINASLNRVKADLIENGKVDTFVGLFEGDRRVKAKEIRTKFGSAWLLHDDEQDLIRRRGRKFLPTGNRSRILKELGLRQANEEAPAWACISGQGAGLSGAANSTVITFRTGCKWGTDATEVKGVRHHPDTR